jgi:hypothetical protein
VTAAKLAEVAADLEAKAVALERDGERGMAQASVAGDDDGVEIAALRVVAATRLRVALEHVRAAGAFLARAERGGSP